MGTADEELRPICYMVMPFRKKKVEEPRPTGAPAEIDFDALWERAYWPAINALGYLPMRADFDPSSAIIKAMLERIAFADLVIADVTLGNGNCYYELGVRHVAQQTNCVLVSPEWCRPLFDITQFASIRFPLIDGAIPPSEADVIRDAIALGVPKVKNSRTPYYELIGDSLADKASKNAFREFAQRIGHFQAKVKSVRLETDPPIREARLDALIKSLTPTAREIPEIAVDLVGLVRDVLGWGATVAFIESLSAPVRQLPWVREQYCLAVSDAGDPQLAIGLLQSLMKELGETSERLGLLGGRYKRLWRNAKRDRLAANAQEPSPSEMQWLGKAIDAYKRGMELDFNSYYSSSNLPALLRARGRKGDAERATVLEHFVLAACDRARTLGTGDEWLHQTLLGAAFRSGDVERAEELTATVEEEGAVRWQLKSTLNDLEQAVAQTADADKRAVLSGLYDRLARIQ